MTIDDNRVQLHDAALEWLAPQPGRIPMLVGGNAPRLVDIALQHAEMLELTGLGRTLPDGHAHEALWSAASVDARVKRVPRSKAAKLRLGALVQRVEVTSDRVSSAEAFRSLLCERIAEERVPSIPDILNTPFVLIGSGAQIVDQLRASQLRWGFSRYTIRDRETNQVANIVHDLT